MTRAQRNRAMRRSLDDAKSVLAILVLGFVLGLVVGVMVSPIWAL